MLQKRVLHLLPHPGGGGEIYVSALGATPEFEHQRFYLSGGRTPMAAAMSLPTRLPVLARQVAASDLLHIHGDAAAVLALPFARLRPSVITTHGLHLLRRSRGQRLIAIRSALKVAVAASRAVITTSSSELQELEAIVRERDRAKLRVIFNGVSPQLAYTAAEKQQVRSELGIAADSVLGIFVGELEPRKEPLLAIAAAERARRSGSPFLLAITGTGPLERAVQEHAGDAVRPLGYRPDLPRLMAAADIFVQPSSREGMSLALLEAMSHGLAVLAADSPGNAEAVGGAGLTFAAGDELALANAISRLVADSRLRSKVGADAKQRATEHFALERFLAETVSVYTAIAVPTSSEELGPP